MRRSLNAPTSRLQRCAALSARWGAAPEVRERAQREAQARCDGVEGANEHGVGAGAEHVRARPKRLEEDEQLRAARADLKQAPGGTSHTKAHGMTTWMKLAAMRGVERAARLLKVRLR
eukprot:6172304-Pleurochrysis_carterae.AAC.2